MCNIALSTRKEARRKHRLVKKNDYLGYNYKVIENIVTVSAANVVGCCIVDTTEDNHAREGHTECQMLAAQSITFERSSSRSFPTLQLKCARRIIIKEITSIVIFINSS